MVIKNALVMFLVLLLGGVAVFSFIELFSWLGVKLIGGIDGKFIGAAVAFATMIFTICLLVAWKYSDRKRK